VNVIITALPTCTASGVSIPYLDFGSGGWWFESKSSHKNLSRFNNWGTIFVTSVYVCLTELKIPLTHIFSKKLVIDGTVTEVLSRKRRELAVPRTNLICKVRSGQKSNPRPTEVTSVTGFHRSPTLELANHFPPYTIEHG
jgi:hypothetical protein